jgi:acyl carrier protein
MGDLLQEVKDVVVENLGCASTEVTETSHFSNDLGADSLDAVELIMALEEKFGVEIPDADAEKIQTVGQAVEFIKQKKGL